MAFEPTTPTAEMYLPGACGLQASVPALPEIVVDSFAGGGGASTGIEMALRSMAASGVPIHSTDVTVAINHNGAALAMHMVNHPNTIHLEADIWAVDPMATSKGRPVGLLWASPDCRDFSSAKGGAPVSDSVRGLAWCVANWAKDVQPRMIFLENVKEFRDWGPLIPGKKEGEMVRDPKRKGETFQLWVQHFRDLGYTVEWKLLRACDYGAPTIRTRLYIIMRWDGLPITWPTPTHADTKSPAVRAGKRLPWRTAAEIIEWDRPCPSILMTDAGGKAYTKATGMKIIRPLAFNTMARIAAGVKRHVLEAEGPFIVTCNHSGPGFRSQGLDEPFKTVTSARDAHGLVVPFITTYYGERGDGSNERASSMGQPLPTVTTANRHGVVYAFLTVHNTGDPDGVPANVPLRAITGKPKTDVIELSTIHPTLTPEQEASARQVAEFLRQHGCWDGGEFVMVGDRIIVDIGMRMLVPRELARAQGFPEDYILAAPYVGAKSGVLSESDQRHKIGNSVCPPVAKALVEANYVPLVRAANRTDQSWLLAEAA